MFHLCTSTLKQMLTAQLRPWWNTVHRLQSIAPDAPNFIMDDFNHCKPGKSLSNFYQHVTCPTRKLKCLDLCYGSIKGSFKSFSRAPSGTSDHNAFYLVPTYKPILKETKPEFCSGLVNGVYSAPPRLFPLHGLGYVQRELL